MPMVPALRILSISGLIRSTTDEGLLVAVGRPNIVFWRAVARVGVMAICIYPLTATWGVAGTAMTVLLGIGLSMPIWAHFSTHVIKSGYSELLKRLLPAIVGAAFMGLAILFTKYGFGIIGFVEFLASVLIAIVAYSAFSLLLWWRFRFGPIKGLQMLKRSV